MGSQISIMQGSDHTEHIEVSGFRVTNAVFPPALHLPFHYHEVACFAVVLQGAVDKRFTRHDYVLPKASMVTMPPQERHCDQFADQGAHLLVVEPVTVNEETLRPCVDLFEFIHFAQDETITSIAYRISREMQIPDAVSPLVVSGLVFEMLAVAMRRQRPFAKKMSPKWLKEIDEYVHAYFRQSFQLVDLAEAVGVHPVYLSRVFREHYGVTFGAYIRSLRVEWAKQKLSHSADSLAQVARGAGFTDQSHFTRVFKKQMGVTPSQYRRSAVG